MVSVIIPNYNHSRYLRQRIDSVLNQSYKDFELIILDDCSDDDSREIISEYVIKRPDIITIFNKKNSGNPFLQWNFGVSHANGEYIWIAESDDSAENTFLERMISVLQNNKDAGLVYCDSVVINENKGIFYNASDIRKNRKKTQQGIFNRKSSYIFFLDNPIINVSSVLFRRKEYLKAGGANSSMMYCADWFLYLKMLENSDIHFINEPLNVYRLHSGSTCYNIYRSNRIIKERLKIYSHILKKKKTFRLFMLIIKKMFKVFVARTFFLLKLENYIRVEIPGIPEQKYIFSL